MSFPQTKGWRSRPSDEKGCLTPFFPESSFMHRITEIQRLHRGADLDNLPRLMGSPATAGILRYEPADFMVRESLAFDAVFDIFIIINFHLLHDFGEMYL